ncbi:NAD(P)/FAD-dependent oxidoreductase [Fusibacter sp. A1]|nr:NAD(P)/FAD-dependent oxidoreductase [Fusibacter sp. A1]RXV62103.1 NAD(P)/FAD-dependent oxidoreductase [Fusibacter sp. A1]
MNKETHIVVLGGGYGGILTAKKLARKYHKHKEVKITLIDRKPYHTMLTELHEVAAGRVPVDAIRINYDKVFAGRAVKVVLDDIHNIDFDNKVLEGIVTCYDYDYLVLGTGSKPTYYGTTGAAEHSFSLWSYEDAVKIKHHILEVFGKASYELDPEKRRHLLTFVVIGCGFTGIEMIGELAEWRDKLCKTFNIPEEEVRMIVADMLPKVLPNFDDRLIRKTMKRLQKMKVEVLLNSPINNVQEDFIEIGGAGKIETYTVIWAAGVEGSDIMAAIDGEKIEKLARNRVQTDMYLRAKGYDNVFVVGDNIFYIPEGEERPVPQMVENAEHSATTVAKNVVATLSGKKLHAYKPEFHGAMVCIGGKYGVAQVGNNKRQFVLSGFFAMLTKHLINFIYFLQIAGFNKLWTYWMHEFFHVEDRRSFFGGYFAKRSPNFWLVPLRMFLGVMWFLEGWHKIDRVLKDPNDIFLLVSKLPVAAASEEATEAAGAAAEWGQALPVPEFISNIVDWSMDLVFYTADGAFTFMATIFQTGMVFAELAVGLCLLGGLFSAPAAIASIIMGMMIWASGMAPPEMLWYIFAGVAMIGGSGSTFGMDYYVLPFLKKHWKKLNFVKKWYLYTD